ncbi:MAG: enoyl-CoA hydratase [Methylobacteriaceae bacterium]|nr:enoyl-CoA hydratase [Methylobacteriaceae bacterium]
MNDKTRFGETADAEVLRADKGGIATLTLNRAAARNALSLALIDALRASIDAIAADRQVRAVVLAANGPAFSAGHDLKELTAHRGDPDRGRAFYAEAMRRCATMMQAIVALPQPVIAAVEGVATAAGCQLVATRDLAVAGEAASFGTPGVNIGLFCSTPMVALTRNVAPKHAMELLLTGELADAPAAYRMGLVNRVVARGRALAAAHALAATIARKSTRVLAIGKKVFYAQREMNLAEAYDYAADVMVQNMLVRDAEEGIGAFVEKREPKWQDR